MELRSWRWREIAASQLESQMPFHESPCKVEVKLNCYELHGLHEGAGARNLAQSPRDIRDVLISIWGTRVQDRLTQIFNNRPPVRQRGEERKTQVNRARRCQECTWNTAGKTDTGKMILVTTNSVSRNSVHLFKPCSHIPSKHTQAFIYKIRTVHHWGSSSLGKKKCYKLHQKGFGSGLNHTLRNHGYPFLFPKLMPRLRYFTKKIFYLDACFILLYYLNLQGQFEFCLDWIF